MLLLLLSVSFFVCSSFAVRMRGFMGKKNVETYFTTESQSETLERESENGVEGEWLLFCFCVCVTLFGLLQQVIH